MNNQIPSKKCKKCGAEAAESARFCSDCGESFIPFTTKLKKFPEEYKKKLEKEGIIQTYIETREQLEEHLKNWVRNPTEKLILRNEEFLPEQYLDKDEKLLLYDVSSNNLWGELGEKLLYGCAIAFICVPLLIFSLIFTSSQIFIISLGGTILATPLIIRAILWYKRLQRKLGLDRRSMREYYEFTVITNKRALLKGIINFERDFSSIHGLEADKDIVSIDLDQIYLTYGPPDLFNDVKIEIHLKTQPSENKLMNIGEIKADFKNLAKIIEFMKENIQAKHLVAKDGSGKISFGNE